MVSLDLQAGAYQEVLADAELLLSQALDSRTRGFVVEALCIALVDLGRFEEVKRRVEAAPEGSLPDYRAALEVGLVTAETALWGGQPRRALALADELLTGIGTSDHNIVFARLVRAWACVEVGRDPGPPVGSQNWPTLFGRGDSGAPAASLRRVPGSR